jgi:glycosyltransferase involved in cell wall biosynthesis
VYCYIGRLVKQKQVELIIKSFYYFKTNLTKKRVKLVIVGNGPEKEKLKNIVKKLKFNKDIKFHNHVNDISEILKKIDVFCMNTKFEGLGLVMLEAMYFSIPIIAPNISAVPEVVQNKSNGILVKPNNIVEYSKAMKAMTKKETRRKYSINSKKILEKKFDLKQMVSHTMKIYKIN